MKFGEIKNDIDRQSKINYVSEVWDSWNSARLQTLSRITNYLFVLNTGGLIATLTYVASKSLNSGIQISIWLFAFGILFSVAHATLDYYLTETSFASYRKDVEQFYENEIAWDEFVKRNESRPPLDFLLHIVGWLGGIAFFIGLVIGLCQIQSA